MLKVAEEEFARAAQKLSGALAKAAMQDAMEDAAQLATPKLLTGGGQTTEAVQAYALEPVSAQKAPVPVPKLAPAPTAQPVTCGCPGSPTRKPRVYICGPMQWVEEHNFPAFDAAAKEWEAAGWEALNPAEMDRQDPLDLEELKRREPTPTRRRMIMRDLDALQRADAIALLPLLGLSYFGSGSAAERYVAEWLRLPTYALSSRYGWTLLVKEIDRRDLNQAGDGW